jgi:hypothetical protein
MASVLILAGGILPLVLFFAPLAVVLYGRTFEMDTDGVRYSFCVVFAFYRQVYAVIFAAGVVLSELPVNGHESRGLFALSAVYALAFVLWVTTCYETYQHVRYKEGGKSPYTGAHYALTLSLAVTSSLLFILGLLEMVCGR